MGGRMEIIMTTTPRPRAPRPQIILEVVAVLGHTAPRAPHLGGPGFADFQPKDATDSYVKISFAKPELGLEPPYDLAALRETLAPADLPVTRTTRCDAWTRRRAPSTSTSWCTATRGSPARGLLPRSRETASCSPAPEAPTGPNRPPTGTSSRATSRRSPRSLPPSRHSRRMRRGSRSSRSVAGTTRRLDHPAGVQLIWVGRAARDESTAALLATAISGHPWPDGRVQVFAMASGSR